MSGALTAASAGPRAAPLKVVIGAGVTASGKAVSHAFATIYPVVTGFTGALTYVWHRAALDANGTWAGNGLTTASLAPSVTAVADTTLADYSVTVTDGSGASATSNLARYDYILVGTA